MLHPERRPRKSLFCTNCQPPEIRHDLAPSPINARSDSGYSFFGRLTDFKDTCQRCRTLRDGVSHFARAFRDIVDPEEVRVECSSLTRSDNDFPSEMSFEFTNMPWMSSINVQINDWAHASRPYHTLDTQIAESIAVFKTWLQLCDSIHQEKCRPRSEYHQPSRLLDIGSDVIRLLDTKFATKRPSLSPPAKRYTALSHCWGLQATVTTTKSNVGSMQAGFSISLLPKTFRDAIEITRQLGVRYIWIDSLCIIQDDRADWEFEASRMGTVYENAVLTIAATRSADGGGGCFSTVRDISYIWQPRAQLNTGKPSSPIHVKADNLWDSLHIKSTQFEHWFTLRPSYDVRYLSRKDASRTIIDAGFPLFTRAWFLQERLLSNRVLHFGHMELLWECRCATWVHHIGPQPLPQADATENQSGMLHSAYFESDYQERIKYPEEPKTRVSQQTKQAEYPIATTRAMFSAMVSKSGPHFREKEPIDIEKYQSWRLLVEEYTRLHLTREDDRLPALSGIAGAQLAGTPYLAGIWAADLPGGLLWTIDLSSPLSGRRPEEYRAPSFSWASIEGPIRYRNQLCTPRKAWDVVPESTGYQIAKIQSFSCTPEGLDPHGRVKSGYIDVEGYTGTATVTRLYQENSNTVCVLTQQDTTRRRQKFYLDAPLALCCTQPAEVGLGDTVTLLLIECEKLPASPVYLHGYRVMVLVLRPAMEVRGAYARVGLICPADDVALYFSEYLSGGADIGGDVSMFDEASRWFDEKRLVKIV